MSVGLHGGRIVNAQIINSMVKDKTVNVTVAVAAPSHVHVVFGCSLVT